MDCRKKSWCTFDGISNQRKILYLVDSASLSFKMNSWCEIKCLLFQFLLKIFEKFFVCLFVERKLSTPDASGIYYWIVNRLDFWVNIWKASMRILHWREFPGETDQLQLSALRISPFSFSFYFGCIQVTSRASSSSSSNVPSVSPAGWCYNSRFHFTVDRMVSADNGPAQLKKTFLLLLSFFSVVVVGFPFFKKNKLRATLM